MDLNAQLALAKQAYEHIESLCAPSAVESWSPTEDQRALYIRNGDTILNALDKLAAAESRRLLANAELHSVVPEGLLRFVREKIEPNKLPLQNALNVLDPEGQVLREFFSGIGRATGLDGRIRRTFEQGLEKIYSLIEDNPGMNFEEHFFPDAAYEVVDSRLLVFDPDAWLDRVGELRPFRTKNANLKLPSHIRYRLEELFRCYAFGCRIAVMSLGRSILEYALIDNANKLGIELKWPPDPRGKRREKRLSELIDDFEEYVPTVSPAMRRIRDLGNDYLHPKRTRTSKEILFGRESSAREVVLLLVETVEAIYEASRET